MTLFLCPVTLILFPVAKEMDPLLQDSCRPLHGEIHNSNSPQEKAMAPLSSTLAWKIPWAEEPGGLQSMGSLRVGND